MRRGRPAPVVAPAAGCVRCDPERRPETHRDDREIPPQLQHLPRELALYCMQFPTVPAWFAQVDPADIVVRPPGSFPCMADAEEGEEPGFDGLGPPGEDRAEEEIPDRTEALACVA